MFHCEILADSLSPQGQRLTTMKVTFPRIVLAEFNTHRMLSRNSASSRAIPFKKMVQMVQENPFIPIAWQKDHKGMQGNEYLIPQEGIYGTIDTWLAARDEAVSLAKSLNKQGVTKQLCNRLLEPFMWHKVLLTATDFENFFNLRCPQYSKIIENKEYYSNYIFNENNYPNFNEKSSELDWLSINKGQAEIHIMDLAEKMYDALNESTPQHLKTDQWHIPYEDNIDDYKLIAECNPDIRVVASNIEDAQSYLIFDKIKIATARCARVSYTVVGDENKPFDYEKDIKLHDTLLKSGHASPMEHIVIAADNLYYANFKGFKSYRKFLEESKKL